MDYLSQNERAVRERTLIIIAARALNKGEARVFNGRRLTNGVPSADPMRNSGAVSSGAATGAFMPTVKMSSFTELASLICH